MVFSPPSLKVRALQWLAQREHSRAELRSKLLHLRRSRPRAPQASDGTAVDGTAVDGGDDCEPAAPEAVAAAEVDALLDWLSARGWLSEQRFVEGRVHARQGQWGTQRIQHELQQHGARLDADTRQALQATEHSRALALWQRKFGAPAVDAPGRLRQMRFLAGRGFAPEVVRRVVRGEATGDDEALES